MPVFSDDDVVMHRDTERFCRIDDRFRHVDIGPRRCRVAARMVVHQDDCGGGKLQRTPHHLTWIDRRMIDRPMALHFVRYQGIALVEEEDTELLAGFVGHCGVAIIDDR